MLLHRVPPAPVRHEGRVRYPVFGWGNGNACIGLKHHHNSKGWEVADTRPSHWAPIRACDINTCVRHFKAFSGLCRGRALSALPLHGGHNACETGGTPLRPYNGPITGLGALLFPAPRGLPTTPPAAHGGPDPKGKGTPRAERGAAGTHAHAGNRTAGPVAATWAYHRGPRSRP